MRRTHWIGAAALVLVLAGACGDDGHEHDHADASASADASSSDASSADAASNPADASLIDGTAGAFTITSTAYSEGGFIPLTHVCGGHGGQNLSPALAWSGAPAGTMAYALLFTDIDNGPAPGFQHSVMWDIPVGTTSLPQGVENEYLPAVPAGAKQTRSYSDGPRGYAGPCPGSQHTYEMKLHAVNIATLSGLDMATSMSAARTAIEAASLGSTTLNGEFNPN